MFTIADIRALNPCYDPVTGVSRYDNSIIHPGGFLPEDWSGTILDVLSMDKCPAKDRLWVVLHEGWVDARTARLFAVWCAREALALADNRNVWRYMNVCDVVERLANGEEVMADEFEATAGVIKSVWLTAHPNVYDLSVEGAVFSAVRESPWDADWGASSALTWCIDNGRIIPRLGSTYTVGEFLASLNAVRDEQVEHLRQMLTTG